MTIITLPVRKAIGDERDEILSILKQNHSENGQFTLSFNKVTDIVDRAFRDEGAIIGVIKGNTKIEALILMVISQFWYTDDWGIEELVNYVLPDCRRSTHAKDLIEFGKRCSDELGIPLTIGIVSNERTRAKMELYRRRLGEPVGGYFIYPRPKENEYPRHRRGI